MMIRLRKQEYSYSFSRWLIRRIRIEVMSEVEGKDFSTLRNYLNQQFSVADSIYSIAQRCLRALEVVVTKSEFIVRINPNLEHKGIKLVTLANLIDFGVTGIRGYNVFSEVFKRVSANTTRYYNMYNPNYYVI